ncbi:MAG: c-type cytochrome [Verrucomicrobiae bacterium]|nr:c-type cytochrome [Verrucomicrobiae bacterium]
MNLLRVVALTLLMIVVLTPVRAKEEPTGKTFFLPKSPTAAAYVLGRLSNQELLAAPRGEFVYVALLQRQGLERKHRLEALDGLAKLRNTDRLTELLAGLAELDRKGETSEPVLQDLSPILLQSKPEVLTAKRTTLETLATESQLAFTRQLGWAGLVTADASFGRAWDQAQPMPDRFADLLWGIPLIRDPALRAGLYSKIEPLLQRADSPEVRRAAISAIVAVPGHESEVFKTLALLLQTDVEKSAALASLQRISKLHWPKDQVGPLLGHLLKELQDTPATERSGANFINAVQFATDLASLLPAEQAAAVGKELRGLGSTVILLRTVPEQMLYDQNLIVVEVGKPVEILLQNDDAMPHNLVITKPGALEEIGMAAEKMPPTPDAQGRLYVPDSPSVLHATVMADPGQTVRVAFQAPDAPGDYPYVCTFPGHWRRMFGNMAVVEDVETYLANRAAAPPPTVTEWRTEDLAPDLAQMDSGRNFTRGRELFTKLACAACHQLGTEGIPYGPDLTDVLARFNHDRTEVLRQILEPSLVISNRYRNFEFELKNGEPLFGMIVSEAADQLTVQTGPSDALIQTLPKAEIQAQHPQNSSLMPLGLLNPLSKEEILDLLAFMEFAGKPPTHEHKH